MKPMDSLFQRVIDMAIAIQQIPAPTFAEERRARFLQRQFEEEKLCDVSMDELGNVYARLEGSGKNHKPLVISAHSDTVFPEDTKLTVRREAERVYGPGIGDNSLGVAGLFGLLWALRERGTRLPGDLWLVVNTCEEGLGDLRGMHAVVDRFGDTALAYVVLEGMALGQIYHRGLEVRRYRITVRTAGGHSWVDFGQPSAIHELASLVSRITGLPLPDKPRTTLNVGVISGGTTVNTIAAEASLELDLRSEQVQAAATLSRQVEDLAREAGRRHGVEVSLEMIGHRPAGAIPASHPLIRLARRSLELQGIAPNLGIGSTDANVPLSRGLPACCLGLSTGGGAHTVGEYINTQPLSLGLGQLLDLVEGAYREL